MITSEIDIFSENNMNTIKSKIKVRLSEQYLTTIKQLAKKYFDSEIVKIFGSRIDLNRKGGDIDIYIKTIKTEGILAAKIAFLRDFEKEHGEQKIDLVVESGNQKMKKIYNIARTEGISI